MRIKLCHTLSRCASRWTLRIVDGHRCCRSNCRARFWRNVTWTPTARPARPRTGYWSTLQPQRRHRELPAATDTNTNTNTSNRRARQRCADTVSHLVHMPRRLWQEAVDNKATPPTRLPLSSLYHITSHAYSHSSDLNRASLRRPCLSRMARHDRVLRSPRHSPSLAFSTVLNTVRVALLGATSGRIISTLRSSIQADHLHHCPRPSCVFP
jgi:hypothetical protein